MRMGIDFVRLELERAGWKHTSIGTRQHSNKVYVWGLDLSDFRRYTTLRVMRLYLNELCNIPCRIIPFGTYIIIALDWAW